jgi:predicted nucleotidyltransferase
MRWGLEPLDLQLLERLLFEPLKARGARVWIFGSRARGDQKKFSDLDVLFEESNPISLVELSKIREELEESELPIKVDLVAVKDLAESYRASVMKDRVEV